MSSLVFNPHHLLQAMNALYSPLSTPKERRSADGYLQRFKQSQDAITLCLRILHEEKSSIEECFLASSTIYDKLLKPSQEVHSNEHAIAVSRELWALLMVPRIQSHFSIFTKLALSVVNVCIQFDGLWRPQQSIVQCMSLFTNGQLNDFGTTTTVLSCLLYVPEEVYNKRVSMPQRRREDCHHMLVDDMHSVFEFLSLGVLKRIQCNEIAELSNDQKMTLRIQVLKTLKNWFEYGDVTLPLLMDNGVLHHVLQALNSQYEAEHAIGIISEIIPRCCYEDFIPAMELMIRSLVQTAMNITTTMSSEQVNSLPFLSGFLTALADSGVEFLRYFLYLPVDPLTMQYLEVMLKFTRMDWNVSYLTFPFWTYFQTYVSGKGDEYIHSFSPFLAQVLNVVVDRSTYPPNYSSFSEDSREEYRVFRREVRNVLRDLVTSSRENEQKFMKQVIEGIFSERSSLVDFNVQGWWRKIETFLHALTSVSQLIPENENEYVPRLLELLVDPCVPPQPQLVFISAIIVSKLPRWFSTNAQFLPVALEILSKCFLIAQTSLVSPQSNEHHVGVVAILKLSKVCKEHMFKQEWIEAIVSCYHSNLKGNIHQIRDQDEITAANTPSSPNGARVVILEQNSLLVLLEALCNIISTARYSDVLTVLHGLLDPVFYTLHEAIERRGNALSTQQEQIEDHIITLCLNHIGIVAYYVPPRIEEKGVHPTVTMFQKHWSIFEVLYNQMGNVRCVVESTCEVFSKLFKNLKYEAVLTCNSLIPLLIAVYTKQFHASILDVMTDILPLTGEDAEVTSYLAAALQTIVSHTLVLTPSAERILAHPDVILKLLYHIRRYGTTHHAGALVEANCLQLVIEIALACIKSGCSQVTEAGLLFFQDYAEWFSAVDKTPKHLIQAADWELFCTIRSAVHDQQLGQTVVHTLLPLLNGGVELEVVDHVASTVHVWFYVFGERNFRSWFEAFLALHPVFPKDSVSYENKKHFLDELMTRENLANKRRFRRILCNFCRTKSGLKTP